MKEGINVACHLRETPGSYGRKYEATTGDVITLFAEHYDARPQGLPSDYWVNDSDYSFQFAANPIKGERLHCLNATYGGKEIIRYPNAADRIQFTVQPGRQTLRLLFSVGSSPYDKGKLVEDCGDGSTKFLCGMNAEYPVVEITIEGKP